MTLPRYATVNYRRSRFEKSTTTELDSESLLTNAVEVGCAGSMAWHRGYKKYLPTKWIISLEHFYYLGVLLIYRTISFSWIN